MQSENELAAAFLFHFEIDRGVARTGTKADQDLGGGVAGGAVDDATGRNQITFAEGSVNTLELRPFFLKKSMHVGVHLTGKPTVV